MLLPFHSFGSQRLMRRSSLLFRERIRRGGCRQAALVLLLLFSYLVILVAPRSISSHEPITTKVMFNREIVRIFQRHCLACHNSESITNISLATYPQARPWAKAFKEEVLEKRMPPNQAVKGFGRFHDDFTLTQHEIDQIVSWVEGGAPRGDDKDLPPESGLLGSWVLGQPDLILEPTKGIEIGEVNISSRKGDEYRCVALPTKLKEARWVTAVDFHPGNGAAVHCASFGIDLSPVRKTSDDSVDCGVSDGTAGHGLGILGTWMPGQTVNRLPKNVARLLPAGARIVLRIHYHKTSEAVSARSSLGLYFAREQAMKPLRAVALAPPEQDIPAGAQRYRIKVSYTMQEAAEAIAIRPLLFPFAKSVEATAHRPDGTTEVLIWARDYRYDWQPDYTFKKPVTLPKGTRIEVIAYLDNSDNNQNNPNNPARAVRFASVLCEVSFINVQRKTH
jgi:mono/diheme cytochrome c family protein